MSDSITNSRPFARADVARDAFEREPSGERTLSTADLAGGEASRSEAGTASFAQATRTEAVRGEESTPLFPAPEAETLRSRWDGVQAGFVDEPRRAVEDADALVAGAMRQLAESFAAERAKLEQQWDRDGEASTEDLRLALKRYRAFFGRLLAL